MYGGRAESRGNGGRDGADADGGIDEMSTTRRVPASTLER
jgi:hypothetical protein